MKRGLNVAIRVAIVAVGPAWAMGAAPGQGQPPPAAVEDGWMPPRMPWGAPDLQGIWSGKTMTPLERPERFAGREFLTDDEVAVLEREATTEPGRDARAAKGTHVDLEGAYNDVFTHRATNVVRTRRTSLIVDPPSGRVPPLTPQGRQRLEAAAGAPEISGRFGTHYGLAPERTAADHPEDRDPDRCLGVTVPPLSASAAFRRIVQAPEHLTIYYENSNAGGAYRTIWLDGRPHLPAHIRQWLGHSVGRWEDDTLVVETTNFTDQTYAVHGQPFVLGLQENQRLVEHFTRAGPDLIMYRVTVDDPSMFTRPWTIEIPLTKQGDKENLIFETACHEGNYALTSILAGARLEEARETTRDGSR